MSGLLHLPSGIGRAAVLDQIPEIPIPGQDTPVDDILATFGQYTWVALPDGQIKTVSTIWDETIDWKKSPQLGDMCIINQVKHNGLNFQPTIDDVITVKFMYMDRVLNFNSKRLITQIRMSEAGWTTTKIILYFIPYESNQTLNSVINKLKAHIEGAKDPSIIEIDYQHSGSTATNDEVGTIVSELPNAGKYMVGMSVEPSQTNACPSIYELNFRTY